MPKKRPPGDLSISRPAEGPPAAAGELTIGSARDHATHVVLLTGELDVATAHRVEDELGAIEATDVEQIILWNSPASVDRG